MKRELADLMIAELAPIAERYRELRAGGPELHDIANDGAEKAQRLAGATYRRAAEAMGL